MILQVFKNSISSNYLALTRKLRWTCQENHFYVWVPVCSEHCLQGRDEPGTRKPQKCPGLAYLEFIFSSPPTRVASVNICLHTASQALFFTRKHVPPQNYWAEFTPIYFLSAHHVAPQGDGALSELEDTWEPGSTFGLRDYE